MESPGEYLKRERELRKASLTSIFDATRVPVKYLEALEADDYDRLPSPAFVKGFIKSYCKHLGLDETDAVLRYEMYMKERPDKAEPARTSFTVKGNEPKDLAKEGQIFNSSWGIAALAGVILIIILSYSLYSRHKGEVAPVNETSKEVNTAASKPADATVAPDTMALPAGPDKGNLAMNAAPAAPAAQPSDNKHTLVVSATEVVWIKVKIDGGEPFDVVLKKGERVVWKAADSFSLVVGNAGGVKLVYDGEEISSLGKSGEVVTLKLPRA